MAQDRRSQRRVLLALSVMLGDIIGDDALNEMPLKCCFQASRVETRLAVPDLA
jgi:hypothetical protein